MSPHFNSGIQCSSLIARFHQIPAEPSALLREFQHEDDSLADINLIRAAKSLGFEAKFITDTVKDLNEETRPAIARDYVGNGRNKNRYTTIKLLLAPLMKGVSEGARER